MVLLNFASTGLGQKIIYLILLFYFLYLIATLSIAVDLANAVGNESYSKQNATRVSGALSLLLATGGLGLAIAGVSLAFLPAPELSYGRKT
jgi:hypothetical protein